MSEGVRVEAYPELNVKLCHDIVQTSTPLKVSYWVASAGSESSMDSDHNKSRVRDLTRWQIITFLSSADYSLVIIYDWDLLPDRTFQTFFAKSFILNSN